MPAQGPRPAPLQAGVGRMDSRGLRFLLAGWLGKALLGAYFPTTRCIREGWEHLAELRRRRQPVVFVFWHGQLLPLVYYHRNEGIVVLVSEHGDGEYIARVIHRYGFGTVRGSSTRGGVKGLKGLLRAAREGRDLGISPDGPRGPRQVFKRGALLAAQLSGLPLLPLAAGCDRAWYLKSWDRFMIPKPFSTLRIRYAPPRWVPRRGTPRELEALALEVEEELKAMSLDLNPLEAAFRSSFREP